LGIAENELGWSRVSFDCLIDRYLSSKVQSLVGVLVEGHIARFCLLDALHSSDDYQIG